MVLVVLFTQQHNERSVCGYTKQETEQSRPHYFECGTRHTMTEGTKYFKRYP